MVWKICETKTRRTLHYPCRFLDRSAFSKRETNLRRSDREELEPAAWICRRKQAQFHLEEKINRSFQGWKSFRNIQVLTVLNSGDGSAISCTNAKAAQKICKTRDSAARIWFTEYNLSVDKSKGSLFICESKFLSQRSVTITVIIVSPPYDFKV